MITTLNKSFATENTGAGGSLTQDPGPKTQDSALPWDLLSLIAAFVAVGMICWMLGGGLISPAVLFALAMVMLAIWCFFGPIATNPPATDQATATPLGGVAATFPSQDPNPARMRGTAAVTRIHRPPSEG